MYMWTGCPQPGWSHETSVTIWLSWDQGPETHSSPHHTAGPNRPHLHPHQSVKPPRTAASTPGGINIPFFSTISRVICAHYAHPINGCHKRSTLSVPVRSLRHVDICPKTGSSNRAKGVLVISHNNHTVIGQHFTVTCNNYE